MAGTSVAVSLSPPGTSGVHAGGVIDEVPLSSLNATSATFGSLSTTATVSHTFNKLVPSAVGASVSILRVGFV